MTPAPYIVEPYATEPSGVVLGWYRIARGAEQIAIVRGEERARAWAAFENKREYQRYVATEQRTGNAPEGRPHE